LSITKCLPWEWTLGPKTGQKRALSLPWNSQTWKMTKNSKKSCFHQNHKKWQKWQKSENQKNRKSDKMQKPEKWKKWKTQKWESEKWKNGKTSKTPKCQINGTFWQFVFSEPPGWALFQFQGVPRDRFLRPKTWYHILNGKWVSCFIHFPLLRNWHFHHFCHFHVLIKVTFLIKLMFCH